MIPPDCDLSNATLEEVFVSADSVRWWYDPTTCLFAGGKARGRFRIRGLRQVVG